MTGESVLNYFEQPGPDRDNKLICGGTVETQSGQSIKTIVATAQFAFTATPGDETYIIPGVTGKITRLSGVLITTAATAGVTIKFEIGATEVTGSLLTIANLDAVGTTYSSVPTANNSITSAQPLKITNDTGGYANGLIRITVEVDID